jgi:hypothetical protein
VERFYKSAVSPAIRTPPDPGESQQPQVVQIAGILLLYGFQHFLSPSLRPIPMKRTSSRFGSRPEVKFL